MHALPVNARLEVGEFRCDCHSRKNRASGVDLEQSRFDFRAPLFAQVALNAVQVQIRTCLPSLERAGSQRLQRPVRLEF